MMGNFNEKSRNTYNKIAFRYNSTLDGKFTQKFKERLIEHVTLRENCRVLDVGCGNGSLLAMLKRRKPTIYGLGVDIAEEMVAAAKSAYPDMEFHAAECEEIPFVDESMDVVTACMAYHHFPDVAAFAREIWRILAPSGELYIAEIRLPAAVRAVLNPWLPLSKSGDVKFYSPTEIVQTLESNGFEKVEAKMRGYIQIIQFRKGAM